MIKAGDLVFGAVYLNPPSNFKQWYNHYENKNQVKTIVGLNTVILTKVNLQSINDIALPTRSSNKLRGNTIRLGVVYLFDDAHDEIIENFQGKN